MYMYTDISSDEIIISLKINLFSYTLYMYIHVVLHVAHNAGTDLPAMKK